MKNIVATQLIQVIQDSDIPADQKAKLIQELKYNKKQDTILTVLRFLGLSMKIISLFIDNK